MSTLLTARLELRQWCPSDLAPFAALNADPVTMEFLCGCLSREDSDAFAERARSELAQRGWGLWALEVRGPGQFIGFVGLSVPSFEAPFTPCTEVGWRLARASWGQGYATEAARVCLRFAFGTLALPEVLATTTPVNTRSRAVMERLGMTRDPADDFDHPKLPPGHPLRRHLLYRIGREAWRAGGGGRIAE